MKIYIFLSILALFIMADKNKWGVESSNDVSTLTKDNFDEFIKTHKFVFVKFYAPWCGHCKSMAPSYSALAKRMNEKENGIPIAELDATIHGEVAEKYAVEGYPTLKFFVDGEPIDYAGERDGEDIENFINKKMNPSSKELKTVEEIKEIQTQKLSAILVTKETDTEQLAAFNSFTMAYESSFYYASFSEALTETQTSGKYNFVVYRNFDEHRQFISSEKPFTSEELKTFYDSVRFPTVMEFDQETAEKIFGSEETSIFLFTNEKSNDFVKLFSEVAKERKGTINFCQSTIKEGLGERLSEYLGITDVDENSLRIVKFDNGNAIKYQLHNWNKEQLLAFLDDFKNDKLNPYFKSDPIPETNSDPVKVIVGNSFNELVLKSDQHVLLEVYAPWCGHCKKLTPIYEELAKKVASHSEIVIAKMDGTTNEHELVTIKGFPTLKFFKKGEKNSPLDFEGDRTLEGFLTFLEKETGIKLTQEGNNEQPIDDSL